VSDSSTYLLVKKQDTRCGDANAPAPPRAPLMGAAAIDFRSRSMAVGFSSERRGLGGSPESRSEPSGQPSGMASGAAEMQLRDLPRSLPLVDAA
jgi:hypothetical protein